MATPSSAIQRPDLGLLYSEFDLIASRSGFIGTRVFPTIPVRLASANFAKIPIGQLLKNRDTARAPGSGYSRSDMKFEQASYMCQENGAEEPVDDREKNIYAYTIDSDVLATERAIDVVLRNLERRVAAKVFDTATWTGSSLTTGVSTAWTNAASATPITDVKAAATKVWENSGLMANTLVLNWTAYRAVSECAQILDRIKYSGKDDPKSVTPQMLAALFDVETVLVAGGQYNSGAVNVSDEGAATLTKIWDSAKAMVCRVARTNDVREPCIGRVFDYVGDGGVAEGRVEEYRDETVRSNIIRCRHDTDEKQLHNEAGHLLTGLA